jgi:N utilization substance protein B
MSYYLVGELLHYCNISTAACSKIGRRAIKWQTDRISRIALSVLRMAFFEVLYLPDTDNAVAANEAVELAKKYDSKESAAFINGILGTLIREKE